MAANGPLVKVVRLPSLPGALSASRDHYNGSSGFKNPWPSAGDHGLLDVLKVRFRRQDKAFKPVPENREGLVPIRTPDWAVKDGPAGRGLRATWIGHATWLVESPAPTPNHDTKPNNTEPSTSSDRGIRVLFDPVFSERASPFSFIGPKRFSPTPCTIQDLPHVDIVVVSHNHYDHLDTASLTQLYRKQASQLTVLCPLGNKQIFTGAGLRDEQVIEMDWWDVAEVAVEGVGCVRLVCTPAQHDSQRSYNDKCKALWSSWCILEADDCSTQNGESVEGKGAGKGEAGSVESGGGRKRLFFAGDTGYRKVPKNDITPEEAEAYPHCPAFKEIGELCGPFDLALLPIGCFRPRDFMSSIHASPDDAVLIHKDIKSRKSIAMHYGAIRGGLSEYYEDVLEPPRRLKEACERENLRWGDEIGLCDIGETVVV